MEVSVTRRKCGLRTVLTWGPCPRRDSTQDRARGTDACPRSPSPVSASWGRRHVALWPRPLQWVLPSWQRDPLGTASSLLAGVALVLPPIPPVFPADVLLARLGHGVQGAPGGQACGAGNSQLHALTRSATVRERLLTLTCVTQLSGTDSPHPLKRPFSP